MDTDAVTLRFYQELNDFLPSEQKGKEFQVTWAGKRSVKDLVESCGVPHVEVDLILMNGKSVDFQTAVKPGCRLSVYPVFESLDIGPVQRLRPAPLRIPRFVVDVHLGKLARKLRLLGFDTIWSNDGEDDELARIADREERILLTRDRGLLMRSRVSRGVWIRSTDPNRQIREIVEKLDLRAAAEPFGRCSACNGALEPTEEESETNRARLEAPPRVRERETVYRRCAACGKLYWDGDHLPAIKAWMAELGVI